MTAAIPSVGAFLSGTVLTTASTQGLPVERRVEELQPGDMLLAIAGPEELAVPVKAVRRLEPAQPRSPLRAGLAPIRIRASAIAPGIPATDLVLPPEALLRCRASGPSDAPVGSGEDAGNLIPAAALVNGLSITREPKAPSHIWFAPELDIHTIILANGAPVATAPRLPVQSQTAALCLPLLTPGPELNVWRGRILDRARAGPAAAIQTEPVRPRRAALPGAVIARSAQSEPSDGLRDEPVRVLVAGAVLHSVKQEPPLTFHYDLPARTGPVRLKSMPRRSANAGESRRLGVCIAEIAIDDVVLAFDSPVFGPGFHPQEADLEMSWRWTSGDAWLVLPYSTPARRLRLRITDWHVTLEPA